MINRILSQLGCICTLKKKKIGEIKFSKPVRIKQFYLRKHNFQAYKRKQQKSGLSPDVIDHFAVGKLNGIEVEKFTKKSYHNVNKWIKMASHKNTLIDTLVFDENTDLDNLLFSIKHMDKSNIPGNLKVSAAGTSLQTTLN